MKCWKYRCEDFHNEEFQRKRFKNQYLEEKREAEKSNYSQVKAYVQLRDINIVNKSTETIKNQIYRLKRIRVKLEKYNVDDIRAYFKVKN